CMEAEWKKNKKIVTTVATSRVVEEACAGFGAETIYTKVGAPYLAEKIAALGESAVIGGEEVGGIIWPKFSLAKDGIFAAAKMCEIICEKSLSEHLSELPVYHNSKEKIEVAPEKKRLCLESAKKHAEGSGGKLCLIDGVRVDFDDSWVIVRASGTENAMRIFAEAKSRKKAEELVREYKDALNVA
ncbi:MAG: phosphoglucosamine mutase, partial [Candidatus Micrarchaeota archaeon]|nr:phosphoglucosamine mutase [Candidatus Micrarchaeota archaeon]